jgi:hypothetical protein
VTEQGKSFSLSFAEVEKITGFPLDHAFLTYKKNSKAPDGKLGKSA